MTYVYPFVSWAYALLPAVAVVLTIVSARRYKCGWPARVLRRSLITGGLLGLTVALLYVHVLRASVPLSQVLVACYRGAAAMCLIGLLNWLSFRVTGGAMHRVASRYRSHARALRALAGLVQSALVVAIGLPYLGSFLLLYRPRSSSPETPFTRMAAPFQTVSFRATDGTPLSGWWIEPARGARTDGRGSARWGRDTVLLCHGFGSDKAGDLHLARDLIANGYNVLAIDLRAHGRSGGQFTGFGGIESRDVLGAVRWVRVAHAGGCNRILGLGESLGAVALIEAAADPSAEGQAIDAIAAYNPYDDLPGLMSEEVELHRQPAVKWAFRHLVLPMASAQIGSDLSRLSPVTAARKLWPRPILVLGNGASRDIGGHTTFDFYRDVLQPKYSYWREDADRRELLDDPTAALTVRIFFDGERSIL